MYISLVKYIYIYMYICIHMRLYIDVHVFREVFHAHMMVCERVQRSMVLI